MASHNCQKIKLLKLMELLRQETDEEHPLVTNEICKRLADMGISCERRTLSKDISLLNEQGFEVMQKWVGKEKGYYIEDRSFSIPELKILIDAVQAAGFITEKKTSQLIDKISALAGSHRGEILKSNMVCFNTRKHTNETIYYSIGYLEEAILYGKKVAFKYFDLNEHNEKVYRKEGGYYTVEPVALVFNEDNYYLMTYSAKYNGTANYRVDRMDQVSVIDESVSAYAKSLRVKIGDYTEQAFKMYGGNLKDITIQFAPSLIGVIYDKFGEDTKIRRIDENTCIARVTVQISPTFWGWIFQFAGEMKITAPRSVIEEYRKRAFIAVS